MNSIIIKSIDIDNFSYNKYSCDIKGKKRVKQEMSIEGSYGDHKKIENKKLARFNILLEDVIVDTDENESPWRDFSMMVTFHFETSTDINKEEKTAMNIYFLEEINRLIIDYTSHDNTPRMDIKNAILDEKKKNDSVPQLNIERDIKKKYKKVK